MGEGLSASEAVAGPKARASTPLVPGSLVPAGQRFDLAIIILNYRTPQLTLDCLASLAVQVDPGAIDVVVLDNASGDGSAEAIEQGIEQANWSAWARVVRSPENGGFSAGNNLGVRSADAQAYLFLNSDTIVRPGAVGSLLRAVGQTGGVVGAHLEWPDGREQENRRAYSRPLHELARGAQTSVISRWAGRSLPEARGGRAGLIAAPWLSFACIAVARGVIEEIGGLDDGFFMYFEDMDFCRRAAEAGFPVGLASDAHVVHLKGGTSPVQSQTAERARRPAYYYAARSRYFAKHYGRTGLWRANMAWHLGRVVGGLREVVGHKVPHACERESRDIWIGWRSPLVPWRPS